MRRRPMLLVPMLATALLAPPVIARAQARYALADTIAFAAASPTHAALIVMREQMARERYMDPLVVYLDGQPFAILPQRTYQSQPLAAGRHCLTGLDGGPDLCFEAVAGDTLLLRLRERVTADDRDDRRWVLDDPVKAHVLARDLELQQVTLADPGVEWLKRRSVYTRGKLAPGRGRALDDVSAAPDSFAGVWYEDPVADAGLSLDQQTQQGTLVFDDAGLRSDNQRVALTVPWSSVQRVRFGASTPIGTQPWLEVDYLDKGEVRTAAFASANEASGVLNYNLMFLAARHHWKRARS